MEHPQLAAVEAEQALGEPRWMGRVLLEGWWKGIKPVPFPQPGSSDREGPRPLTEKLGQLNGGRELFFMRNWLVL